jgi:hypothetical protein
MVYLLFETIVFSEPAYADFKDCRGRRLRLLPVDLQDHDSVPIDPIENSPSGDPKLVAASAEDRHGAGLRHRENLSTLETPQKIAGLHT